MSEEVEETTPSSSEDFWEQILVRGLNSVITYGDYSDVKKELMSNHPDILRSRLDAIDISIQMRIVEGILTENPSLFLEEDFWWDYVGKALSRFDSCDDMFVHNHGGWFVLLNRIKDMKEKVDWFKVLTRLSQATVEAGSKTQGLATVLGWLEAADKENLKKLLYRTETKKYPKKLKQELYNRLIDYGLLDIKVARRIRSDTSGALSSKVLAHLFETRHAYTDDDFQNLVTQFSDTKHKWVARYIAMNMPMHLVPFLMGIKDKTALKILEKRMEAADSEE